MNPTEKFIEFQAKLPKIFDKAVAVTRDFVTLAKIYDNYRLFNRISNSSCLIFADLIRAVFALKSQPEDSFLIQFTDIDLYGIFTSDQYLGFVRGVSDTIEDYGISVNLYQVVISGHRQKLVFACTDHVHFDKLQAYARDCFGTDVSVSDNQLTVNIITQNESEIAENYNKLYNFINNRNDQPCCESMKQIQLLQEMDYNYRRYSCNNSLTALNIADLIAALKSANINAPIFIGCTNVINGDHNTMMLTTAGKKELAGRWVTANPPGDKEVTTAYYKRYASAVTNPIASNQFGNIVRDDGYETVKNNGTRYWRI